MKKRLIFVTAVIIAVVAFIFVYRYYNNEDKTTSLTVNEKRWVQENKSKDVDIEIINDYPIYGMEGDGVFYDLVNDLKKNVGLSINEIPYLKTSKPRTNSIRFRILVIIILQ